MASLSLKTNWDLSSFYESINDQNIEKDIEKLKSLVEEFNLKYKGNINKLSIKEIENLLKEESKISSIGNKIGIFLSLSSSLNTQDQDIIKKLGGFETVVIEISNKLLFLTQEFKDLGYGKLIKLSKEKELKNYSNYFHQKAINNKYLLDEKTEFALNVKSVASKSAFTSLYDELTNSFEFEVNINGNTKILTDAEVRALRTEKDENIRKEAYRSIRKVYNDKKIKITIGNTYKAVVKDCIADVKIRNFNSVMSKRNIREEIPDEVVEILLQEVEKAYPLMHKYLRIKAKLLGKKKLMNWDLFAPIGNFEKDFNFNESVNLYLKVMKDFDLEFYNYSKEMLESGRVDAFPKKGKRGGAFCSYEKGVSSFVLLNHTNKIRDVATLAHELGHATHGYFAQEQENQVYSSGLCLAETASVFNETILSDYIKKDLNDEEKLSFLEKNLDYAFSTIFRQIQYILFEKRVHESFLNGKELGAEDFSIMWREEQRKLYGDIVEYDVEDKEESGWATIPHIFHVPFYCYSYSFGNILSYALYNMYKKEGDKFIEKYKNILRSGGSKPPYELLKENGLDIKSRKYYQSGLKVISDMLEEFEDLANKHG